MPKEVSGTSRDRTLPLYTRTSTAPSFELRHFVCAIRSLSIPRISKITTGLESFNGRFKMIAERKGLPVREFCLEARKIIQHDVKGPVANELNVLPADHLNMRQPFGDNIETNPESRNKDASNFRSAPSQRLPQMKSAAQGGVMLLSTEARRHKFSTSQILGTYGLANAHTHHVHLMHEASPRDCHCPSALHTLVSRSPPAQNS